MNAPVAFPWLADELSTALAMVPGSQEREHISAILRGAPRIRLGADVTRAIAETLRGAPLSVERCLKKVSLLGFSSLWLEYPHQDRIEAFGKNDGPVPEDPPVTVGCLLAANPADEDGIVVFVCWKTRAGALHHSYALVHWDLKRMAAEASGSDGLEDAYGRMAALASVNVPQGFADEMEIWQRIPRARKAGFARSIAQTKREAMGEHLFLLTTLLMLASPAVELTKSDRVADAGSSVASSWSASMKLTTRAFLFSARPGFSLSWLRRRLVWNPGTSAAQPGSGGTRL